MHRQHRQESPDTQMQVRHPERRLVRWLQKLCLHGKRSCISEPEAADSMLFSSGILHVVAEGALNHVREMCKCRTYRASIASREARRGEELRGSQVQRLHEHLEVKGAK